MATIIHEIALGGICKADGTPNAGGLVMLRRPGSANVSVTAYADRDKSAAVAMDAGGYRLDAAGRAALFIDEDCNVIVEDEDGAQVASFTISPSVSANLIEVIHSGFTGLDPTSGQYVAGGRAYLDDILDSLFATFGGVDALLKTTGTTTPIALAQVIAKMGFMPQMFGAKGDGATDDITAMNALASVVTTGTYAKPIYIPAGNYRISAAWTFPNAALLPIIIRGSGMRSTFITQTVAAANGIVIGTSAAIDMRDLAVEHSSNNGTTGISCTNPSSEAYFQRVAVEATEFTTSLSCGPSTVRALSCVLPVISGTNPVLIHTSPTTSDSTAIQAAFASKAQTFDMANGGSTTPVANAGINVVRIRGTSAGGGTVNATATTPSQFPFGTILVLECYNNSGGAYTFTLNAQYKNSGNPAPANGSRVTVMFVADPTDNAWVAMGRETST